MGDRPLAPGASMSAASRVAVTAAGAATSVSVARLLGPSGAGSYFVAQSISLVLLRASTLGIEHGINYFVSTGSWAAGAAWRAAVRMAAVTGAVAAAVGLGLRLLVPSAFAGLSVSLTAITVAGVPFTLAWFYVSYVGLAVDRYEAYVVPSAAQSVLALALAVPGAIAYGLKGAIVGTTVSSVVVGAGSVGWARLRLGGRQPQEARQNLKRAIAFGVKGYSANALQLLNYRLDLFILAAVASTTVVGEYSVAVAVTSLMWLLPSALSDVIFPRIARLSARADHEHRALVETKSLRLVTLLVALTTVALVGGLVLLVVPVYGSRFHASVNLGLILLPGVSLIGVTNVLGATVVGRGRPIYALYGVLFTTPLTLALYATLIPWLHASGAALASTLSYAAGFTAWCIYYRRVTNRPVLRSLMPTRSELNDLWAVLRTGLSWARGRPG